MIVELMIAALLAPSTRHGPCYFIIPSADVSLGKKLRQSPHFDLIVLSRCDDKISLTRRFACMRQIHIINGQIVCILYFSYQLPSSHLVYEYLPFLRTAYKHLLAGKVAENANNGQLLLRWTFEDWLAGLVPPPGC